MDSNFVADLFDLFRIDLFRIATEVSIDGFIVDNISKSPRGVVTYCINEASGYEWTFANQDVVVHLGCADVECVTFSRTGMSKIVNIEFKILKLLSSVDMEE